MGTSPKRLFFVPDMHVPYHDKKAFALVLKAVKRFKPDTLIILGDFLDFWPISAHGKDYKRRPTLRDELEAGAKALKQFKDAAGTKCRCIFISGNHCNRLDRYLTSDKGVAFLKPLVDSGLIDLEKATVPSLLNLKGNGWEWIPYKEHLKIGKLHVTHDLGKAGHAAAADAEATFQSNAVIGHVHSINYTVRGNMQGKSHVGASFGWLGDRKHVDYMYKAKALRNWALGFGIGYQEANGVTHLQPVPIINYKCIVEGTLVTA